MRLLWTRSKVLEVCLEIFLFLFFFFTVPAAMWQSGTSGGKTRIETVAFMYTYVCIWRYMYVINIRMYICIYMLNPFNNFLVIAYVKHFLPLYFFEWTMWASYNASWRLLYTTLYELKRDFKHTLAQVSISSEENWRKLNE